MNKLVKENNQAVAPWTRVFILVLAVVAIASISKSVTGAIIPTSDADIFIFQNALLLIVLGSAVIEHKFTKPGDVVVNSLMGMITLLGVSNTTLSISWVVIFVYSILLFLLSSMCTIVSTSPEIYGWREKIARITYRPSVELGSARRYFSIVFFFAVLSYYDTRSNETAALTVFWGIFMILWPLGLPEFLTRISFRSKIERTAIGKIARTDYPNIVRASLQPNVEWDLEHLYIHSKSDGSSSHLLPLYSQIKDDRLIGTALSIGKPFTSDRTHLFGMIYPSELSTKEVPKKIIEHLGGGDSSELAGFIVEDSEISMVRFEVRESATCHEGQLVWCEIEGKKVYYQITNGKTNDEAMQSDRHGFQTAEAAQIGILDEKQGFIKFDWLPLMNTPVFSEGNEFGGDLPSLKQNDFEYGTLPYSGIKIGGQFSKTFDHHTAILGVTGSGKSELGFDMIREAVTQGIKVVCIDLTATYEGRLSDLKPSDLSISEDQSTELGNKLFDVDSGKYGAGDEKKVLKKYSTSLRDDINKTIDAFLGPNSEDSLGIITLNEISNTKATLFITELYMTCLLNYAKTNKGDCPKILIVVEEAHTVMPEPNTMGLGDFDSKGLVSKIGQIALQGRKYGVGLLVIAQRTATVSKTVLTQCNTIISFTCFDDTSLKFLQNLFGPAHIKLIPDLPPLHAIAFGKGIRSQRPIVFQIPWDKEKAQIE